VLLLSLFVMALLTIRFSAPFHKKTPDGRVSVFLINNGSLNAIKQAMEGQKSDNATIDELAKDIQKVNPQSVVFNWECCSDCSSNTFGRYNDDVMIMAKFLLDRKHMVMFSDFSLKALIAQWQPDKLGPNPFCQIGTFSESMDLRFKAGVLKECPSAQLAKVGQLCENGEATVHALGGTIMYTVNKEAMAPSFTNAYKLEILTIAVRCGTDAIPQDKHCSVFAYSGAAGHVLLRYPSGGLLLTSSGHWIELVRLDVTEEGLLKEAERQYGTSRAKEMYSEMQTVNGEARNRMMQGYSSRMVQECAPCSYTT